MSNDSVDNRVAAVELLLETGETLIPYKYNADWSFWLAHRGGSTVPCRIMEWVVYSYKLEDDTEVIL